MDNISLSVIVPAYNEEENIKRITDRLSDLLENQMSYEIIFVDDGSKDGTWNFIEEEAKARPRVRGVRFSRNFGKEAAIFAGLSEALGSCAVVIDSDLQHPPEKILEMYKLWQSGYEVIECVKTDRGEESGLHRIMANGFYKIMSSFTKIDMKNASDFKLLDRKAIDALLSMPERNMFFRALSSWIGFKTCRVRFEVAERESGASKWSTSKLVEYALNNIASFSGLPLQGITFLGGISLIASVIFWIISVCCGVSGSSAGLYVILAAIFTVGGFIMVGMGFIGYYLNKVYEGIKCRPRYLVEEKCNAEKADK